MATFTNATKNTSTFGNNSITGVVLWSEAIATWDSALLYWDSSPLAQYTNATKNTTSFANLTKN